MAVLYVLCTVWLWSLIPLAVKVAYQSFSFFPVFLGTPGRPQAACLSSRPPAAP
jgi:hypothetical protein